MEQGIQIYEKEGNDTTFYSINPKKDLEEGNHVIVTKCYDEGKAVFSEKYKKNSYRCQVLIGDKEVTLWLTEKQHVGFKAVGEEGSVIKMTKFENQFENKKSGLKMLYNDLKFEKVE